MKPCNLAAQTAPSQAPAASSRSFATCRSRQQSEPAALCHSICSADPQRRQWPAQSSGRSSVSCRVAADEEIQYVQDASFAAPDYYKELESEELDNAESEDPEPLVQPLPRADVQQTLRKSFFLSNFAVHSDEQALIRVRPALAGEGRYFVRVPEGTIREAADAEVDAERSAVGEDEEAESRQRGAASSAQNGSEDAEKIVVREEGDRAILAISSNAVPFPEDSLFTTLQQGDERVFSVEVLLAALEACGVDNARIEVEGNGELPTYDGSAAGFAHLVKWAGIRTAPALDGAASRRKQPLAPQKVVTVREGDSFISLVPSTSSRVSYGIDHTSVAPVIGKQWASWSPTDTEELHFRWALAPARAYFASPQERLDRLAEGYFKACYEELFATADGKSYVRLDELRFTDEPARRRLLEFVGDLSLLSEGGRGGLPQGHIIAFQANRALHFRFLRAVKKVCGESE